MAITVGFIRAIGVRMDEVFVPTINVVLEEDMGLTSKLEEDVNLLAKLEENFGISALLEKGLSIISWLEEKFNMIGRTKK